VRWLDESHGVAAEPLAYHVERGGVLLKDAAALAGLGVIGRHNLLLTPSSGTRVRLRALWVGARLEPSSALDRSPCDGCPAPCRAACPRRAFETGSYARSACQHQMAADERARVKVDAVPGGTRAHERIEYCRACELACPVLSF
jgi:epoxyqueuosine reductase